MSEKSILRCVGWDHVRCMDPVQASIRDYAAIAPEVEIQWAARSLYDFGEGNLEALVDDADLIIFDHPFCGEIAQADIFQNLQPYLKPSEIASLERDSVGPSWRSYQAGDRILALPIDAAAQVSAYRPDRFDELGLKLPVTFDDVLELAGALATMGLYIAGPLKPTDATCLFFTLMANTGSPVPRNGGRLGDIENIISTLTKIKTLQQAAFPASRHWSPISCLDYMATRAEVLYVPYLFGYTNYSRPDNETMIAFTNIPAAGTIGSEGSTLGGAGIGITRSCEDSQVAFDYARYICSAEYQSAAYTINGGQPWSLTAWTNSANDAAVGGFFSATLHTMQNAYLRPTFDGFVPFFRDASDRVERFLADKVPADRTAKQLIDSFEKAWAGSQANVDLTKK